MFDIEKFLLISFILNFQFYQLKVRLIYLTQLKNVLK